MFCVSTPVLDIDIDVDVLRPRRHGDGRLAALEGRILDRLFSARS